jgi:hypothetical protein
MIMQKAEIKNGKVVNVLEIDPENIPDWCASWPNIADGAGIGWSYDGTQFTAPEPKQPTLEEQSAARAAAYRAESDPLFFMSQRGEATVEEWQSKVAEIKAQFPYPSE